MMIHKRLIGTVGQSKKYIAANVALQWLSLAANMTMMTCIAHFLSGLYARRLGDTSFYALIGIGAAALLIRYACTILSHEMSFQSSKAVKRRMRELIYQKLLRLGTAYREQVQTSEIVQVAVEGVEQLESYFGAYLPQFFYAMIAPVTLFVYLSLINLPSAIILFLCVPLIPITIAAVQTWAKKLLAKYWNQYTALGDSFLENLQGLTTLKIYQSDAYKNEQMNQESEKFRIVTMKVLTMQLNSITLMDLIAYGGAAIGIILAVSQFSMGHVSLAGCFIIILLSADFFLPMRQLGSFFHVAMNGMAASDKIFRLLDLPESDQKSRSCPDNCSVICQNVGFGYEEGRPVIHDLNLNIPSGSFTALVGESGCGKSTAAGILMGRNKNFSGKITVGGVPLSEIAEKSLLKHFTYVGHHSYIFKGTVREFLHAGDPDADDLKLWTVLKQVNLYDFLKHESGLETVIAEQGSNLSGGQCQRLALARALLHDSQVYIFDEATSNIDVESENDIMQQIHELARHKTVILISHRLVNAVCADRIYVMEKGSIAEFGTHSELLRQNGLYTKLWDAQQTLENYAGGVQA